MVDEHASQTANAAAKRTAARQRLREIRANYTLRESPPTGGAPLRVYTRDQLREMRCLLYLLGVLTNCG